METIVTLVHANLTSPMVLCFVLGMTAALLRSDLTIPQAVAKGMSIYLLFAIGFKGGVEIAKQGLTVDLTKTMCIGILLSFAIPWIGFRILRATTKLAALDAAAISAHYGSISIVTFVAATQTLEFAGISYDNSLVAVAAVMEAPAIISALYLLRQQQTKTTTAAYSMASGGISSGQATVSGPMPMREVFLNSSIILLAGAFIIGLISGEKGFSTVKSLLVDPFKGVLCFFLLDMGLLAGRHFKEGMKHLTFPVISFGVYMPLISATLAFALAFPLGIPAGSLALLITLAASASYIAVPAALRIALPKANPAIYLTMSLAVTFPFNLTVGIPLYLTLAQTFS